jgi:hypothetical protein
MVHAQVSQQERTGLARGIANFRAKVPADGANRLQIDSLSMIHAEVSPEKMHALRGHSSAPK